MMPSSDTTPWVWIIEHLSAVGWPALVYCAWQGSKYVDRLGRQAVKTIDQIDTLSTNHFPHMQKSLENQDALLLTMDANIKIIADNSRRRREDL